MSETLHSEPGERPRRDEDDEDHATTRTIREIALQAMCETSYDPHEAVDLFIQRLEDKHPALARRRRHDAYYRWGIDTCRSSLNDKRTNIADKLKDITVEQIEIQEVAAAKKAKGTGKVPPVGPQPYTQASLRLAADIVLNWPVTTGLPLGEATAGQIIENVTRRRTRRKTEADRDDWMETVANGMPKDKPALVVRQVYTELQLQKSAVKAGLFGRRHD